MATFPPTKPLGLVLSAAFHHIFLRYCLSVDTARLVPITMISIFRDNASGICLEWRLDVEGGDDAGTSTSSTSSSPIDSRPLTTFCAAVSRLGVLYHDAAKCMPAGDKRSQPILHATIGFLNPSNPQWFLHFSSPYYISFCST